MNTKLSFFGITPEEYNRMMVCFQASEKSFSTDETVCFYADHPDRIGYLLEGEAAIIRTHLDGRQTILEYLKTGDVFGSALSALSPNGDSLQVICTKSCKIQFIDYAHPDQTLPKCLQFPQSFSQQCSSADFQKSDRPFGEHLEILSLRRTTKKKNSCAISKNLHRSSTQTALRCPFL